MARTACGAPPGELRKYIPKAYGNDKDNDPVTIWYRVPTERQKRELGSKDERMRLAIGEDNLPILDEEGNPKIEIDMSAEMERQHLTLERFVEKVENYTCADGQAIVAGEDLAKYAEPDIFNEVVAEIFSSMALGGASAKKSKEQPASVSAETKASSGIANNAESTDLTSNETATGTATQGLSMSYQERGLL